MGKKQAAQVLFNRWAREYEHSLHSYGYQAPQRIFAALWPLLAARPQDTFRILDLGIGTGMTSRPFRDTARVHITGADLSEKMLDLCRNSGVADELLQIDLARDDLPFDSRSFDAVISGGMMEFIPDPLPLIMEVSRVLKPGGLVTVTHETPATKSLYRPNFFEGVLEDRDGRVVVQRLALQRFRPCLYKKYLYSAELIEKIFFHADLVKQDASSFTAYRWPGSGEVVYDLFTARKG
jgi:ubiquinone/menaquinone biosynthesis C-methylase UbiE